MIDQNIFKIHTGEPFSRMENRTARRSDMSARAKGVLIVLLGLPDNWSINQGHISKMFSDGVTSIRSGMRELEELGYIEIIRSRNEKGQVQRNEIHVYSVPKKFTPNGQIDFVTGIDILFPESDFTVLAKPKQSRQNSQDDPKNKDIKNKDIKNSLTGEPVNKKSKTEKKVPSSEKEETETTKLRRMGKHPAVQAHKGVVRRYVSMTLRPMIIEAVGDDPNRSETWKKEDDPLIVEWKDHLMKYCSKYANHFNVDYQIETFLTNRSLGYRGNGNGGKKSWAQNAKTKKEDDYDWSKNEYTFEKALADAISRGDKKWEAQVREAIRERDHVEVAA